MKIKNNKHIYGFTLLELMVTLAIAAILVTIALPSLSSVIRNSRMTANANDLLTFINYARSEAVTRNTDVIVKSRNGDAWEDGWDVYIDADGDDTVDPGEELRTHEALATGYTLNANIASGLAGEVKYIADGLMSDVTGGSFYLCLNNDASTARAIRVNNVGRAKVSRVGAADFLVGQCAP